MRRVFALVGLVGVALAFGPGALAQPPDEKGPPKKGKKGPPGFRLGKVLPPHIAEELDLTEEQREEIARLEKEVRARLEKILTARQKKLVESLGPKGKKKKKKKFDDKDDFPDRPKKEPENAAKAPAGIQWFATLASARAEAARTGRPIFLVSAAPHCAGVSGIW